MACGLAILAFHRLRLRRLTRQLSDRFEERLAERTRIAQDLHDTLLQGFLSASMQLHVADNELPVESAAKPRVGRVLELMGQVIEEGRNTVRGLRSNSNVSLSLEESFSRIPEDLAIEEQIDFRVVVEGRSRPLHPIIRDEVYRIGREALVNAFRHSRARQIEVEVEYLEKQLRILVRDDGQGIDSKVLRSGREGHWGLSGMRERAERIGARFKVRSRPAAGTEVELSVPGDVAFQTEYRLRPPGWFGRFYPRRAAVGSKEVERQTR
jgi:signal transduction histidine kinase